MNSGFSLYCIKKPPFFNMAYKCCKCNRKNHGQHGILTSQMKDNMIPGSKGYAFHACMKKQGFGTHKT
ncbi:hypothetical protein ANACAC_00960 [Anaerostipes caccae L1-92]|uniref:Uncharacterized protein n=1 Tax=Anaerostipes caccae (strain DSM 14662 / CCUG 47493 / JCM 13470 / NCIMB 13811 / L1-92) TaxID=411490 RepID=B0MC16_ANACD|nr:hypothetical protein ANACAC_00960 [Anaerostipes caccae L1-92]